MKRPYLCIAHRGGQQGPQNSIESIEHSLNLGVDAIEIDIWHIEGKLLVTHDGRLGGALPGSGPLLQQPLEQLKKLKLRNGEAVPFLHDILNKVRDGILLNIEIKNPGTALPLIQALENYREASGNTLDNIVVSSFNHQELFTLMKNKKEIKRGVLIKDIPIDYAACCDALGAYSFHTHVSYTTADLVKDAHKRGLQHWVHTGNFEDEWQSMLDIGVDGVFTDFTEKFMAFRDSVSQ